MESRWIVIGWMALLLLGCGVDDEPDRRIVARPTPDGPNVIIIVLDTTRGDRCSFNGTGARDTTPRLDAFAKEAWVFENAWTPAGWTGPAHASLFTGLRPENHGYLGGVKSHLDQGYTTLAERFANAGYETGCFTNNSFVSPDFGLAQGFEMFAPMYETFKGNVGRSDATHAKAADWAIDVDRAGGRFFLFINDLEPHLPYEPPEEVAARFLPEDASPDEIATARAFSFREVIETNFGKRRLTPRQLEIMSALYDAEIATLDASIGRLFDRLDGAGILDEALVVVTSDHGENLGDHGFVDHKHSLHRSIGHVPLVIRFPGRLAGGRRVSSIVRLEDVAPTLLSVCGIPTTDALDGASLEADLDGRVARATFGTTMTWYRTARESFPWLPSDRFKLSIRSVVDGRHHLIRWSDGREELYDILKDPRELVNLVSSTSDEMLETLRALLPAE